MSNAEIIADLTKIMEKIFDVSDLKISMDTVATDVEDWDSLNHIQMVVAVEKHFKIKFSAAQIQNWKNVGEIIDSISSKLTA